VALDADDLSRFVLLLEDLAPATQGDQLRGCTPEVAASAVRELVGLHAPRWGDPTLAGIEWLTGDRETGRMMLTMLLPNLWDGFTERYAADLGEPVHAAGAALFAHLGNYLTPTGGPETVVHGDYRLDNLLLRADGGVAGVVDWQTCTVGPALSDVAYFIGAGLTAEDRRAHEEALVRDYHAGLEGAGVTGYPWEQCWTDYRRGTFAGLMMAVAASMLVERTPRGDEMFLTMAARHSRHVLDLDAAELIAG
jgi:aminoglycoside/choline kinase family phosphotransferase